MRKMKIINYYLSTNDFKDKFIMEKIEITKEKFLQLLEMNCQSLYVGVKGRGACAEYVLNVVKENINDFII